MNTNEDNSCLKPTHHTSCSLRGKKEERETERSSTLSCCRERWRWLGDPKVISACVRLNLLAAGHFLVQITMQSYVFRRHLRGMYWVPDGRLSEFFRHHPYMVIDWTKCWLDSLIERQCKDSNFKAYMGRPCCSLRSRQMIKPHLFQKVWLSTAIEKQDKKKKKKKSKRGIIKKLKQLRYVTKIKKANMDHEQKLLTRIERAKKKIVSLKEALKDFELPPLPPPKHDPEMLTAEELHYLKRLGYKHKNYMILGVRGIFGGVVLNMHLHWKKHQLVKVRCKNFSKDDINETGAQLARLSGGIVVDVQKGDTIVMYRGRNYERPEELTPKNTLSKRKALFKAKFEQSLESTEKNLVALEKELALYREYKAKEEAGLFSQRPREGYISSWSDTEDEQPMVPLVCHSDSEDIDVNPAFVCESDSVLETDSDSEVLETGLDSQGVVGSEMESESLSGSKL